LHEGVYTPMCIDSQAPAAADNGRPSEKPAAARSERQTTASART
jgi:hypothetical protein